MTRRILWVLPVFIICGCSPVSNPSAAPRVDAALPFSLVQTVLAYGPRSSGSEANRRLAAFIAATAEKFGGKAEIQNFTGITPVGTVAFRNVAVTLPGLDTRRYVIVGCHFDTKKMDSIPDFPGANDGASGVGVLLAMIKAGAEFKSPPPFSLKFIFFDGEECFFDYSEKDGIFGSRHYATAMARAEDIGNCRAVIILDMVGDRDLTVTLPPDTDARLSALFFKAVAAVGAQGAFRYSSCEIVDDHTPFRQRGIPSIDIIDYEYGPANAWWHTAEDTLDKLSPDSLRTVGDIALYMLWNIK